MRRLNEIEKRLARYICDGEKHYVYEILEIELKREESNSEWQGYQVSLTDREIIVLSERQSPHSDPTINIASLLVFFVKLIQLLEEQGYIYLHTPHDLLEAERNKDGKAIGNISNTLIKGSAPRIVMSDQIEKELANIFLKEITITEEFKQYIGRDFKTQEDAQYEEQLRISKAAVRISLVIGGASFIMAIVSIWQNSINQPVYKPALQSIIKNQNQQVKFLDSANVRLKKIHQQFPTLLDSSKMAFPGKQKAKD